MSYSNNGYELIDGLLNSKNISEKRELPKDISDYLMKREEFVLNTLDRLKILLKKDDYTEKIQNVLLYAKGHCKIGGDCIMNKRLMPREAGDYDLIYNCGIKDRCPHDTVYEPIITDDLSAKIE